MKAKRKSDGKIIEVKDWSGRRELYSDPDMNHFYQAEDLDFLPEKETAVLEGWLCRDIYKQLWLFDCKEKPYRVSLVSEENPPTTWGADIIQEAVAISIIPLRDVAERA